MPKKKEQPRYNFEYQPYVGVIVRDNTTGKILSAHPSHKAAHEWVAALPQAPPETRD